MIKPCGCTVNDVSVTLKIQQTATKFKGQKFKVLALIPLKHEIFDENMITASWRMENEQN